MAWQSHQFTLSWLQPICLFLISVANAGQLAAEDSGADIEFFETKIRPLLVEHCLECHGENKQEGGLQLVSHETFVKGGDSGALIMPGKPGESLLIRAVRYLDEPKMPPKKKLADAEIALLTQWVEKGAPWPASSSPTGVPTTGFHVTPEQQHWWAFQPVQKSHPPAVRNDRWPRNEIDRYILAELEARDLSPSSPAEKWTWLRRASYDLTGLPPTPDELDAFMADDSDGAYERVVDRLLDAPSYGQRWARHWLDVVRYADYHDGDPKARNPVCEPLEAWRYRDWVVEAFNRDLPFDQFITHQIAGDLLSSPDGSEPYANGLVATTFLVNGAWDRGDADKEKMVSDMVDDQIDTVGKAFLGLTLGCSRCHDHKFDPVAQSDYYALAGIFYSTRMLKELGTKGGEITLQRRPLVPQEIVDQYEAAVKTIAELNAGLAALDKQSPPPPPDDPGRRALLEKRDELQKELPPEPPVGLAVSEGGVPGGLFPGIQDVRIHIRGSYTRMGTVVPRRMPSFFAGDNQPLIVQGSGRRELAAWIAAKNNPLTARVIVNRVWQSHFGAGLVRTPNNFGRLSEPPTHPALLDWLADRFMEDGWSLKKLHRRIMLSATWRQAGGTSATSSDDPENRWLGRFAARRLEAEAIRDAILSVNGTLDLSTGGPASHDVSIPRRSLYVQTARWDRSNFATLFDASNPDASDEKRSVSTVAPQALFLMNNSFTLEQATRLANRLKHEIPDDVPNVADERVRHAYRLLFSRLPQTEELTMARELVGDPTDQSGWIDLTQVLLCSNEFIYID